MRRVLVFGLAAVALSACSFSPPKDVAQESRTFYDEVATGADLSKDPHVDASLQTDDAKAKLAAMRADIPAGPPKTASITGWSFNTDAATGGNAQIGYTFVYPDRTIRAQVVLAKGPGQAGWSIVGFQAGRQGATSLPAQVGAPPKASSSSSSDPSAPHTGGD